MSRDLKEGLERMKLASQQDKASPRTQATCPRTGTGRKSGALLAAIKSLAADIAAIKLAVPIFNNEDGQQSPQAVHPQASAPTSSEQQWEGASISKVAQTAGKTTNIVPLLHQGRRPPMHVPYAPPVTLMHLHEMHARPAKSSTPLASPADPVLAASPDPADAHSSSTSVTPGPGPSTPSPACATSPPAAAAGQPAISESNDVSRRSSPFLSPPPQLFPSSLSSDLAERAVAEVNETLPLVSRDKGCCLFIIAD
jgi:hypothetical protein